ncbi:MAG: hypothetical protein K8I30_01930 [Anaerolineae bacterium]|nr:hypothetical protein [Anaerolineae bacterium]
MMKSKMYLFAGWVSANPRTARIVLLSISTAMFLVGAGASLADGLAGGGPH